ncbi:MAG: CAAX prenyl protease-related protein [Acidobacteria bacterium]|nr:CAAX prenyl protease-related protein [Acidobacteriota bacterium]
MLRHPSVPYVLPFAVFLLFLVLQPYNPLPGPIEQVVRVAVLTAAIWFLSRPVLDFRLATPMMTVLFGVAIFVLWILPDTLFPGYRSHWLFTNSITGAVSSSIPADDLRSPLVLAFRTMRAALLVPIVEELFWRGWLMRWLDNPDFEKVPFGRYAHHAFWVTAVLFGSEHGPFWEVGIVAGAAYNYWAIRTKRLGDCILAHGVTNLCLSAYTIATGKWEYWM